MSTDIDGERTRRILPLTGRSGYKVSQKCPNFLGSWICIEPASPGHANSS